MIDEILASADKIEKLFATFKISMIMGVIINLIIIVILFKITDLFINKLHNKFKSNENAPAFERIFPIFEKVIKFLIVFFIVASFLQSHGYSLTSLIAGFGITGLAIGFAAQHTLASMFGTIGIITDKIYKVGDYIKVNNIEGTVENINLRSTKIRSLENYLITIPNDLVSDSVVENVTRAHKRRIDITFGITYNTSNEKLEKALEIIRFVAQRHPEVYDDYIANIEELDSSSINLRLIAFAKTRIYTEFVRIRSEVYFDVIKAFREEGIEFAFPTTTVYLAKD